MSNAFLERQLAELEQYQSSPEIMAIVNKTLPNASEPTNFDLWLECLAESVRDHKAVIEEWAAGV